MAAHADGQRLGTPFSTAHQSDHSAKLLPVDQFVDVIMRAAKPATDRAPAQPAEKVAVMKTVLPLETRMQGGHMHYAGGTVEHFFFANERSLADMAQQMTGPDRDAYTAALAAVRDPYRSMTGSAAASIQTIDDYLRFSRDPGVQARLVVALV